MWIVYCAQCQILSPFFITNPFMAVSRQQLADLGLTPYTAECDVCGGDFDERAAQAHTRSNAPVGRKTPSRNFQCLRCKMTFTRMERLVAHSATHTLKLMYACIVCQRSFTRKSALLVHLRSIHASQPAPADEAVSRDDGRVSAVPEGSKGGDEGGDGSDSRAEK